MPTSTDPVNLTVAEQRAMIVASAWAIEGTSRESRVRIRRPHRPPIVITRAVLDNLVHHGLMERERVEHQPRLTGVEEVDPNDDERDEPYRYRWTLSDAGVERLQADVAIRKLERKDEPVLVAPGWRHLSAKRRGR